MNVQSTLEKIANQGLKQTSSDDMMLLACAYWYERFNPNLARVSSLSNDEQAIIGYLTEFFSTFSCISESRALELVDLANTIKSGLKPKNSETQNVDEIGAEWGLHEDIRNTIQDILHMQTRHYQHTPWSLLSCYDELFS